MTKSIRSILFISALVLFGNSHSHGHNIDGVFHTSWERGRITGALKNFCISIQKSTENYPEDEKITCPNLDEEVLVNELHAKHRHPPETKYSVDYEVYDGHKIHHGGSGQHASIGRYHYACDNDDNGNFHNHDEGGNNHKWVNGEPTERVTGIPSENCDNLPSSNSPQPLLSNPLPPSSNNNLLLLFEPSFQQPSRNQESSGTENDEEEVVPENENPVSLSFYIRNLDPLTDEDGIEYYTKNLHKNQPADLLNSTIIEHANELYKKSRPLGFMPGPFADLFLQRQDHYKIEAIKQLMEKRSPAIDPMNYANPNFYLTGHEISLNCVMGAIRQAQRYAALAMVGKAIREEDDEFDFNQDCLGHLEEGQIERIREEQGCEHEILDEQTLGEGSVEYQLLVPSHIFHTDNPDLNEYIKKIYILNATGGPAVQTVLDLDEEEGWTEGQDWHQPWTKVETLDDDTYQMLLNWSAPEID